jgi:hypothetical protein
VQTSGPSPTVLLVQGKYDLRPRGPAKTWTLSPKGLIVYGGGGFSKFRDAVALACGDVSDCEADGSPLAYSAGVSLWLTRFLAADVSFFKPLDVRVEGKADTYRFSSFVESRIFNFGGKLGVPIGPVRIFGQGGVNYHRAITGTTQTIDNKTVTIGDIPQTFEGGTTSIRQKTKGWGWQFGAGAEFWMKPSVAIYGELSRTRLKGPAVEGPAGNLDEYVNAVLFGARVRLGR